jgi:hypothetical protein
MGIIAPKSISLARPAPVHRTLRADTSRWIRPRECRMASDEATSQSSAQASRHGSLPRARRSSPSSSSIV